MKGVVLAGGYGTRMAPCTAVTNKHLLPVYTDAGAFPMIVFPISTLVSAGIEDILIVSSKEHCGDIIEHLGDGKEYNANFTYRIQDLAHVQLGIGSALKIAQPFTGRDDFAVILGDNYFEDDFTYVVNNFNSSCHIFLKHVDNPRQYGTVKWRESSDKAWMQIEKIVEKPHTPPSNHAVTGLYFFTPDVYLEAEKLKPSIRGELEIVDILNKYVDTDDITQTMLDGYWSDLGTPTSMKRVQRYLEKNES